jgi:hypothetical protein
VYRDALSGLKKPWRAGESLGISNLPVFGNLPGVRRTAKVGRDTMNELSNGSWAADGFSAPSIDELRQVEGGLYLDFTSMKAFYTSVAEWCQELARNSRT